MKKAVLLLNLGTPSQPTTKGVRAFYRHFFADPYVFDMPAWQRWLLRNLIIMPLRAPKTALLYKSIWMDEGSPLKVYNDRLERSLQSSLQINKGQGQTELTEDDVTVLSGMAYSDPFIGDSMAQLERDGCTDILVLPLFPQYSTATTASVFHGVKTAAQRWQKPVKLHFIEDLFAEPEFIGAWTSLIEKHLPTQDVDHVIFSYHGLPESHLTKADNHGCCNFGKCCDSIGSHNRLCYRAQCMATTRAIVAELGWSTDFYSEAFQSRFGREAWIQPYLDEHIVELVAQGKKNIAVVTPSFVSDCLETIQEIGVEYKELFKENGGENFYLLPNLNDETTWLAAIQSIVSRRLVEIK